MHLSAFSDESSGPDYEGEEMFSLQQSGLTLEQL